MKTKKLILDVIGEAVKEYGFSYTPVPKVPSVWEFTKKVGIITQTIRLYNVHLGFGKKIALHFITTAWGHEGGTDATYLIPKERRPEYGCWECENEGELEEVLLEFVEIIKNYGIKELDRMSIEEEVIPTNEMGRKLADSYEMLNKKFINENQLDVDNRIKENMKQWFKTIQQKIEVTQDNPYQDVHEMLVEITAFVGEQLRKDLGGEWQGICRGIRLYKLNTYERGITFNLAQVVDAWKHNSIEIVEEIYFLLLDGQLPITLEQKKELDKRWEHPLDFRFR